MDSPIVFEDTLLKSEKVEISFVPSNKGNLLIQSEHVRFEHISIQLDAGASIPKQSKKKSFQMKFNNLQERFLKKEMNCNQLLTGLSLLIGNKNN
ncbi:unnamed protein product [Rotaria magnacalcarata]|uniref:Uncharacterized protein n=1 Tax=Rotaria magnacalcarata TaxID=392030 RepID=A0A815V447_9BILA|nr:unnamed protein product [Rotaria magnacalcarata]CAF4055648.1 unnamed protein product [Rotaria magnacalcarata]CAF4109613.1 unnamed protein product [Rotaria magnacalcarata]